MAAEGAAVAKLLAFGPDVIGFYCPRSFVHL
jgi:hypothetical protein